MAKAGMKKPFGHKNEPKNDVKPVPELQGKAKESKAKVKTPPKK